ncbi:hypothetical protein BDN70DRAFT_881578 [Pholiota conissans]|uniref:Secreted protein n=1 Tax=Pholiota conissans TaxID=109636 RepID=A0A9P5YXQ3_9AGAR|nr:hypothetical protein BDN70DRAFT_881578 [Pholiota conissans]
MSSQPHPRRFILSYAACILHALVDTTSSVRLPHASRVGIRRRRRRRARARAGIPTPTVTGPRKRAWADTRCAWPRSLE